MYKAGERVRWRTPLDADYSYGTILEINRGIATVVGSGYYHGVISEIHIRHMEKLSRGGKKVGSNSKKYSKRSTSKVKLQRS